MARPPRKSDGDKQQRRRRRRLYILSNHDGCSGVSIYKLNEDDFDSDDAYSEDDVDGDSGSGSISSSGSNGRVGHFAAQARFDSEYDVDSRARHLRHRRLVGRLATRLRPEFVAAGTKIVGLDSGSLHRAADLTFTFDARTRLVSATPPLRSPKKYDAFWAIGSTVYALDTSADEPSHGKGQRCFFERLGPESRPRCYGDSLWEALPRPPFKLGQLVVSHAVHPDGATVFLSVYKTGTFSFDTESLEWERPGDWVLPFDGEGYYVRDLDAWVGLCSRHRGRLAACRVVDDRRDGAEPGCKCGRDLLFRHTWQRHDHASLVHMGNARFCLLETVKQPDRHSSCSCCGGGIEPMLLRVVTFRVQYSWDGELCVVNRRAKVYKLPWHSSSEKPRGFWI